MQLPSIEPNLFGAAVAALHEKLPRLVDGELKKRISSILPLLLPPSHLFISREENEAINQIETIKQLCYQILQMLKYTEGYVTSFIRPIEGIHRTFHNFLEEFTTQGISSEKKDELLTVRAELSGVGLGYFSLAPEVAYRLLSKAPNGQNCRTNQHGTHAVHQENGVFYKPNPVGRFRIGPEVEFAIYALYQLMGNHGAAPVALAKLRYIFFQGSSNSYGRVLQASYGIDGILLQEMIGMAEVITCLDRCFGVSAKRVLEEMLLLENNVISVSKENDSNSIEKTAAPYFEKFTDLFSSRPVNERCLEFIELPINDATIRDIYAHISQYSTKRLDGALLLLERYPQLTTITTEEKIRNSSLVEVTDFWFYLQKIKSHFPSLSTEEVWKELSEWQDRWDPADFTTHFLITLLSNPCDHKTDNLMITWNRGEKGEILSLKLVGIDNDLAFASSSHGVRSVLYLLSSMKNQFDEGIMQKLQENTSEGFVLDWLIALETQNRGYDLWQKQGALHQEDLWEEGDRALHIPLEISSDLVDSIYRKVKLILSLDKMSHKKMLRIIEPTLAYAYENAMKENGSIEDAYASVKNYFPDEDRSVPMKQSVEQAAVQFIEGLSIEQFSLKQQVLLIGKALEAFPSSVRISLPGEASSSKSRQDFFFLAVNQGYHVLVAHLLGEEKRAMLEGHDIDTPLLELRTPEDRTAFHLAAHKLDQSMCQLLLAYGADPQAVDIEGKGALTLCLDRFVKAPELVCSLVSFLGEGTGILFNPPSGHRHWTPLHYLIRAAAEIPEKAEPLLAYLIRRGACPDLVDDYGESALDLAIKQESERLIQQLINLGAGRTLNVPAAQNFFKDRSHLNDTFSLLCNQSPLLRWRLMLEEFRSCGISSSSITLEGVELGKIILSPEIKEKLLDNQGDIKGMFRYGRRSVW